MRRSLPIFTLNRECVPLAFQAGHAGSISATRSTGKTVWSKCGQDREAAPGEAPSRPFDLEVLWVAPTGSETIAAALKSGWGRWLRCASSVLICFCGGRSSLGLWLSFARDGPGNTGRHEWRAAGSRLVVDDFMPNVVDPFASRSAPLNCVCVAPTGFEPALPP
jgi:hypothetical protein